MTTLSPETRLDPSRLGHAPLDHAPLEQARLEQAKGALMLLYGVNSHAAHAVLLRWSRQSGADIGRLAHVLLHAICQNDPLTEVREGHLVSWVRAQLGPEDD